MMSSNRVALFVAIGLLCALSSRQASAQELETETARVMKTGAFKAATGVEYQTSSEGQEVALPVLLEAGVLMDRLELVVEPVAFTAILPNSGPHARGVGDTEVTLVGLAVEEHEWLPALALAAEVKIPTARNSLIGTQKFDYAGYLILSKRFGGLDTHFNVGYTLLGRPQGVQVNNIFNFALAARYLAGERWDFFGEILANTTSSPEAESGTGSGLGSAAELAGGELVGTLGVGYRVAPSLLLSVGVSLDNNMAVLIHPGLTFTHQLF
jgi:hypothetical protein